jgi:hypothetical protein
VKAIRSNANCRIGLFNAPRVDPDAGVGVTGQSEVIIATVAVKRTNVFYTALHTMKNDRFHERVVQL